MQSNFRRYALVLAGLSAVIAPPQLAAQAVTVVASGLVNPRGIAQAPNGWLYVAESGNADGANCDPPKPLLSGPAPSGSESS